MGSNLPGNTSQSGETWSKETKKKFGFRNDSQKLFIWFHVQNDHREDAPRFIPRKDFYES